MPVVAEYTTWNPVLHVVVVEGKLTSEELRRRTLRFTYVDRDTEYDHIEWELDNTDGLLTKPEYIAVGLMVMIKIGYIDGTFPWKAFIINRVRGGLGVSRNPSAEYPEARAAVGENESKVTFYGRNRNALGGRTGKQQWVNGARAPTKKKQKGAPFRATIDVTMHELLLSRKSRPRTVKATTTSEAITRLAERNGFTGAYTRIEPTLDVIPAGQITVPTGESDGQYMAKHAARLGFIFKLDGDILHWHSPYWPGADSDIVETLTYGAGGDITKLDVDCDFQLPIPEFVKGTGWSYRYRRAVVSNLGKDKSQRQSNLGGFGVRYKLFKNPERARSLEHIETIPMVVDTQPQADKKAVQHFISRHVRAFQLNVSCVGNPKLLAGRLIKIKGVGSPFADGTWRVAEARHVLANDTYTTDLHLKQPPANRPSSGSITRGAVANTEKDRAQGQSTRGAFYTRRGNRNRPKDDPLRGVPVNPNIKVTVEYLPP